MMKDYSEDLLKIQEAGRKLPELIVQDRQMALAFLSQNIIASQRIIEYIAETYEAANE